MCTHRRTGVKHRVQESGRCPKGGDRRDGLAEEDMIEIGLVLLVIGLLAACGAGLWRLLRGRPATGWRLLGRWTVLCLGIAPAVLYGTWQLSRARTFQLFGELVTHVETAEPAVALTFDDGP